MTPKFHDRPLINQTDAGDGLEGGENESSIVPHTVGRISKGDPTMQAMKYAGDCRQTLGYPSYM